MGVTRSHKGRTYEGRIHEDRIHKGRIHEGRNCRVIVALFSSHPFRNSSKDFDETINHWF